MLILEMNGGWIYYRPVFLDIVNLIDKMFREVLPFLVLVVDAFWERLARELIWFVFVVLYVWFSSGNLDRGFRGEI